MASRANSAATGSPHKVKSSPNTQKVKSAHARLIKHEKPSDKVNPKTINPFEKGQAKSVFSSAYQQGHVPCRLMHGSVKHKLQWTTPPEQLKFDPVLVILAEGLRETVHPYAFVANEGFIQLLTVEDAESKTLPVLQKLITPFKMALASIGSSELTRNHMGQFMSLINILIGHRTFLASTDDKCFSSTLDALVQLSNTIGPLLNAYLRNILPQISRRIMKKTHRDTITNAVNKIERNGGAEATSIIKARIPTYVSVL